MKRYLVALLLLCCAVTANAQIKAHGYKVEQLVKPSAFHGVHGLTFDKEGRLYAGSVVGESIYRVDINTGKTEVVIGPPDGMADDLVFGPDGTLVWTAINQSVVRARKGNGPIRVIGEKLPGANSIAFRPSDGRLFMGQVFAGDGLWELDPTGVKPPRNILKDIGGLNGFDFGPDGWIYGPLWFKKQVVKINPDTGELKVVADGFGTPAAANFDSKWNLYVDDTARGQLVRVDIKTGAKTVAALLSTSLDNLAIDSKDRIFVSNMADNGIQEVDVKSGHARQVLKGSLAIPVGLSAVAAGDHDAIYVADIFAFRVVDGKTGRVTDIERSHADGVHIEYPVGVSANDQHVLVMSGANVLEFARKEGKFLKEWKGVPASGAIELDSGAILLAQGNTLLRVESNGDRKPLVDDLGRIGGLAVKNGDAFVADQMGGRIVRVKLGSGAEQVIATGLKTPEGIAITADGHLLTVEFGTRRILSIDTNNGLVAEVASNLPLGLHGADRADLPVGLAVGPSGAIYFASDVENSIYKLTKQ
jgi:sugar lactone lactonase YvrE